MRISEHACRRARELASLELDENLSQIEQARLAVHVRRCQPCREFRLGAHAISGALRAAPLEPIPRQVMLPYRRRMTLRVLQAGVAAALVVATGVGAFLPLHSHFRRQLGQPVVVRGGSDQSELRVLRNVRLQQIKPRAVGLAGGIQ
jgi:predicted anti-sigma-YlaC factor YlaD